VLYALKNRIARMAWLEGALAEGDKILADLYFTLKKLDLDLADQLSRAVLDGVDSTGLDGVRLRLEAERSSLVEVVRELGIAVG
jgi:hypothetical protein